MKDVFVFETYPFPDFWVRDFLSIGIYKSPKKFLCWGLQRGIHFAGFRRVLRMLVSVEGNHRVP
jgi:hypothetical protein